MSTLIFFRLRSELERAVGDRGLTAEERKSQQAEMERLYLEIEKARDR